MYFAAVSSYPEIPVEAVDFTCLKQCCRTPGGTEHSASATKDQIAFFMPLSKLIPPGPCNASNINPPMIESVWKK